MNGKLTPLDWLVTNTDCHIVISHRPMKDGYVEVMRNNIRIRAHRLMYEKRYGPIPHGMSVLHKCDQRDCVNPAHLFIGTYADNSRDMCAKGRQAKGEKNGCAKLTTEQAEAIARDYVKGKPSGNPKDWGNARLLAKQYGVSKGHIHQITTRAWKHLHITRRTP